MAIAFGGADSGRTTGSGISISWTGPTVSGSNTYGIVIVENIPGAGDTLVSVTWNAVSMTQAVKQHFTSGPTNKYCYIYVLAGVTTGTILVTSTSTTLTAFAGYYTGAQTTTSPDSVGSLENTASGNDAVTLTNSANAWVIASHASASANPSSTWNSTERANDLTDADLVDSNGTVGANNSSTGWTWSTSDHHVLTAVSIVAASAPAPKGSFLTFM